jgi:hypothetical protein
LLDHKSSAGSFSAGAPAGAFFRGRRRLHLALSGEQAMANTITVTVPHDLGVETAKKRLAERIEALQREYVDKVAKSEVTWSGDVATIHVAALGQTATAEMTVLAEMVRIEVQLPWLLAKLSGALQGFISHNANDVLRIPSKKS